MLPPDRGQNECYCPEVECLSAGGTARGQCSGVERAGWDQRQHGHGHACVTASQAPSNFLGSNFAGQVMKELSGHSK